MGFIDRIKSLFSSKEKENVRLVVHYHDIEDWIDKQSSDLILEADKQIKQHNQSIHSQLAALKDNLIKLKNAQLMNDNVAVRARQIMEGNRDNYIKQVEQLVRDVDTSNYGFFSSKEIVKTFPKELEQFSSNTAKSYHVLQQFFAHESKAVLQNINKIAQDMTRIREIIEKNEVNVLFSARDVLKEIEEKEAVLAKHKDEIREKRKEIHQLRLMREKLEEKLDKLRESKEYTQFSNLRKEKQELLEKIRKIETQIQNSFSILERPLKKFARMSMHEKLINKYLMHPMIALSEDTAFEIMKVLSGVHDAITSGKLGLKDKQKEKALLEIRGLRKEFLHSKKKEYLALKDQKFQLDRKIKANPLMQDYNDLEYKIEHYKNKSKKSIAHINEFEKVSFKAQLDELRTNLQTTLNTYNSSIVLSFSERNEQNKKPKAKKNQVTKEKVDEAITKMNSPSPKEAQKKSSSSQNKAAASPDSLVNFDPDEDLAISQKESEEPVGNKSDNNKRNVLNE